MKRHNRDGGWLFNQTKSYTFLDDFFDARIANLSLSCCKGAQLRARFDTDAVKLRFRPELPKWPKLLGVAAASSLATLFVVRNFFPAEKKVRHPIRANYNVGDDIFVRTMGHLLGPALVEGNKVAPLENGDQIFPAMLSGIRSAQRTITFENFLFQEGEISDAFAQALAERARASGKVPFLQDALGCDSVHGRAIKLMKRAGVAVEIFRFVYFSRINYRTHRKILVIDGALGFLGGVGISDAWKGNGRTHGLWRDSHYQVQGPVVAQLQQAFMDHWLETRSELLNACVYFA